MFPLQMRCFSATALHLAKEHNARGKSRLPKGHLVLGASSAGFPQQEHSLTLWKSANIPGLLPISLDGPCCLSAHPWMWSKPPQIRADFIPVCGLCLCAVLWLLQTQRTAQPLQLQPEGLQEWAPWMQTWAFHTQLDWWSTELTLTNAIITGTGVKCLPWDPWFSARLRASLQQTLSVTITFVCYPKPLRTGLVHLGLIPLLPLQDPHFRAEQQINICLFSGFNVVPPS